MIERGTRLYGGDPVAKLRELHNELANSNDPSQPGSEAREEWEKALHEAGPAFISVAEENGRLLSLIRKIAYSHDAECGRQLARRHLATQHHDPGPASRSGTCAQECKAEIAAVVMEQMLGEVDALFRQKLEDRRIELPWLVMAMTPDDEVVLKGNVSADVLRSLSAALNDAADTLAASEPDAAAH